MNAMNLLLLLVQLGLVLPYQTGHFPLRWQRRFCYNFAGVLIKKCVKNRSLNWAVWANCLHLKDVSSTFMGSGWEQFDRTTTRIVLVFTWQTKNKSSVCEERGATVGFAGLMSMIWTLVYQVWFPFVTKENVCYSYHCFDLARKLLIIFVNKSLWYIFFIGMEAKNFKVVRLIFSQIVCFCIIKLTDPHYKGWVLLQLQCLS